MAALQLAAARAPGAIERLFSRGLYPRLSSGLSCLTALLPLSLAEVALAALLAWLAHRVFRALRALRRKKRKVARSAMVNSLARVLLAAGGMYVAFLLLWGLNYQREPFARSAGLDVRPAAVSELEALALSLVEEANSLRAAVEEDGDGVMRLRDGTGGALGRAAAGLAAAGRVYPALAGRCARPKPALTSPLLSRLGITGIYSPFTAEAHVNTSVPDPELPFSASHELAHARGFAREDEANYLGYLACRLHPDPDFRYSGVLSASLYAQAALARVDRAARDGIEERRSPAVRRDVDALAAWVARYRGAAMEASHRVTDAYLRSQGQVEGIRSYGRMVDLLLAERRGRR